MIDTRTQRYRYNPEPPYQGDMPGWPNIERRTFESDGHVPDDEGWVIHPEFAKKPQISSVAAETEGLEAEIAGELLAAGEPPRAKRGRKPKQ